MLRGWCSVCSLTNHEGLFQGYTFSLPFFTLEQKVGYQKIIYLRLSAAGLA